MFALEVQQPKAEALISGQLEALDFYREPPADVLGQRVAIRAGEFEPADLWLLRAARVAFDQKQRFPRGVIGSARIVGWIEWQRGQIVRQVRSDGGDRPFRRPRGVCGPYSWILRQPSRSGAAPEVELFTLRAGYWDLPEVQRHLLCYVEQHGVAGLAPYQLTQLERLRSEREAKR